MNPLGLPRKQLYIMLKRLKAVSMPAQDIDKVADEALPLKIMYIT